MRRPKFINMYLVIHSACAEYRTLHMEFSKHAECEVSSLMRCTRMGAIDLFMQRRFGLEQEESSASATLVLLKDFF